jgi:hypothetical protein
MTRWSSDNVAPRVWKAGLKVSIVENIEGSGGLGISALVRLVVDIRYFPGDGNG